MSKTSRRGAPAHSERSFSVQSLCFSAAVKYVAGIALIAACAPDVGDDGSVGQSLEAAPPRDTQELLSQNSVRPNSPLESPDVPSRHEGDAPARANASRALLFPSAGLYGPDVDYVLHDGDVSIMFGKRGMRLLKQSDIETSMVQVTFEGGEATRIDGALEQPGKLSSFAGPKDRWRSGLPTFRRLIYNDVWPGIDVVYDLRKDAIEYSLIVAPGADLSLARFRYTDIDELSVSAEGELHIATAQGLLRESAPIAVQTVDGKTVNIVVGFDVIEPGLYGFKTGAYDATRALLIDPVLDYSTFLGSPNDDRASAMVLGNDDTLYLTGTTQGLFPAPPNTPLLIPPGKAVFVTHLSSDAATLLWTVILAGTSNDTAEAIAVDAAGTVTVAGHTRSTDFPITVGAYDQVHGSIIEAFVTRIAADASTLLWSTFLGGSELDYVYGISLTGSGEATVVGRTMSPDYPSTTGSYDASFDRTKSSFSLGGTGPSETFFAGDGFASRLSGDGSSLLWSTFLGGAGTDQATAICEDSAGDLVIVGTGSGSGFPTTAGAYASSSGSTRHAFVAKLSPDGALLRWSSLLGGGDIDRAYAVAVDDTDSIYVAGNSLSINFPTTKNAINRTVNPEGSGFVFRMSSDGSSLVWSTFLGGSAASLDLDSAGNVVITGHTINPAFETTPGAYDETFGGARDAFVSRISSDGATLLWSTFIGGIELDSGNAIVSGADDGIWVTGTTESPSFPVHGAAPQTTLAGWDDVFLTHFSLPASTRPIVDKLFDNHRGPSSTPQLSFGATTSKVTGMHYEVQWDTEFLFSGPASTMRHSAVDAGFENLVLPSDAAPFNTDDQVGFTVQPVDALTDGDTIWWRTRSIAAPNSAPGYWSSPHSFTIDMTRDVDWFQTTAEQFSGNDHRMTTVSIPDAHVVATPTGPFTSLPIPISWGGNASLIEVGAVQNANGRNAESPADNTSGYAEFFFSAEQLPRDAVVEGVEVSALVFKTGPRTVAAVAQLSTDQGITFSAPYSAPVSTIKTAVVLGGPADNWGQTWNAAAPTRDPLMVRLDLTIEGGGSATRAFVDHLWINVHYRSESSREMRSTVISLSNFPGANGWSTYRWTQGGTGQLTVDLLDLTGAPIGATGTTSAAGEGSVDISNIDPTAFPQVILRAIFDTPTDPSTALLNWSVQPNTSGNRSPTANAGPNQNGNEGDAITLDGSASNDADGDSLTYSWVQTAGTIVSLSNPATPSPTFTAPPVAITEILTFALTVNDGTVDSAASTVSVTVNSLFNNAPIAVAGPDQTVNEGSSVTLIGTASSDPNGDPLSYNWQQVSGADVGVTGQTIASPTFTLGVVTQDTTLAFELIVNDGLVDSAVSSVAITMLNTVNELPIALAGTAQSIGEGTGISVTLNGSGSDVNGDALTYTWTQVSGPMVTLSDSTSASPTFDSLTVTSDTALIFELRVHDGQDASLPSQTTVTVTNSINEAPIADAGPAQSTGEGIQVTLGGTSSDPNGDSISYAWTQTTGDAVTLSDVTSPAPTFQSPVVTSDQALTFRLVVSDGTLDSIPSTITITVNNSTNEPPVANPGPSQTVSEGQNVTLDGAGSSDPNGDTITYTWSQIAGSPITLSNPTLAAPTFTAPTVASATTLTFSLTVHDTFGDPSSAATVDIVVNDASNAVPLAVALASPSTSGELATVTLDGTSSSDGDGDPLTYLWSQSGTPTVTLSTPNAPTTTFTTPNVAADTALTFELVVNDGAVSSTAVSVTVNVQNDQNEAPVASAGVDRTVAEGTAVVLDGSGSDDVNGDALTYNWVQTAGDGVAFDATSPTPSFTAPAVTSATLLTFALTVNDGSADSLATAASTVTITVANSANEGPTADAGSGQIVDEGDFVSLSGLASIDPNGDALTYHWLQTSGPAVLLDVSTPAQPTFTAPVVLMESTCVFTLTVSDGQVESAPATVNIVVRNSVNEAPVADAGADQSVAETSDVVLSAVASSDPNGDALAYAWIQISGPPVGLTVTSEVMLHFVAPSVAASVDLEFELTVDDGLGLSHTDTVLVTIGNTTNAAPVANPGVDATVNEGAWVTLDGSGSGDSDGDALTYQWVQVSGPTASLDDATLVSPTFTAPTVGVSQDVTFSLIVSDGQLTSVDGRVVITIVNVFNDPPIADAGLAQSVDENVWVLLSAAASSDANEDALTYTWTQTSGPAVTLTRSGTSRWDFESPRVVAQIELTFELVVHDGTVESVPATVVVTVGNSINEIPLSDPGPNQTVGEAETIALDGTASSDPNSEALAYQWTLVSNEDLVDLSIDDATSPTPSITTGTVLKDATLVFELIVNDGLASSQPSQVSVSILNSINEPPIANAGTDQLAVATQTVYLDATLSSDVNLDALTYQWTQVGGPTITLSDAASPLPNFAAPSSETPEQLTVELRVTDSHGDSSTDTVVIDLAATVGPPVIVSSPRRVTMVHEPYRYDADGVVSAAGSTPMSFELLEGPAQMALHATTGLLAWTPDAEGEYPVTIGVANTSGNTEQTFVLEVFGKPQITSLPSTEFLLGMDYGYDGRHLGGEASARAFMPSGPSAEGAPPLYWSVVQGPDNMVIVRSNGVLRWQPDTIDTVQVTLRVSNAFGHNDQSFEISRSGNGLPTIEPTANLLGAMHEPYVYDMDSRVSIVDATAAERIVLRVKEAPLGFYVHPVTHHVSWMPNAVGEHVITLALETPTGGALSEYTFTVDVQVVFDATPGPSAWVTATPQSGQSPLTVVFDASQSRGTSDHPLMIYRWDFGDDEVYSSSESIVSHTYTRPGRFVAVMTAIDVLGARGSTSVDIGVAEQENQPPTAMIEADNLEGQDQLTVRFNCRCNDADGELRSILWNFGDGESASVNNPTHTYLQPGSYRARVTVRDAAGLSASDDVEINILAGDRPAPSVTIYATPSEGDRPLRVDFSVQAEVHGQDPAFIWDLGGGEVQSAPQLSKTYFDAGYYNVAVEMRSRDADGNVLRSFDQRTVFVTAEGLLPPRIVSTPTVMAVVGVPYSYDLDGRAVAQGSAPMVWRVGAQLEGVMQYRPEGMSVDLSTGEITWTPTVEQVGSHTINLVAENAVGAGVQQFEVEVVGAVLTVPPQEGCGCSSTDATESGGWMVVIAWMTQGWRQRRRRA